MWLLAILSLLIICTVASASPILYTFTGNGTGTLDGTIFQQADFEVVGLGDTDFVFYNNTFGLWESPFLAGDATFDIDGVGAGVFNGTAAVFNNLSSEFLAFRRLGPSSDPNLLTIFASGVGLDTWDHQTNFGPLTQYPSFGGGFSGGLDTSMGFLQFTSSGPVTFTATIAPIPVPASAWLFGSALGLLGWIRRKGKLFHAKTPQ